MKWLYALLAALIGDGSVGASLLFGGSWLANEEERKNKKRGK